MQQIMLQFPIPRNLRNLSYKVLVISQPSRSTIFLKSDAINLRLSSSYRNNTKPDWVKSLPPSKRALLNLEITTMHPSWLTKLEVSLTSPTFLELKSFLRKEKRAGQIVYPKKQDIYSWSRLTPLNTVKVVILGQDPYHRPNQAHGLSFSIRPPNPLPESMKNIYKALQNDYPNIQPLPDKLYLKSLSTKHCKFLLDTVQKPREGEASPGRLGLLTPWARQGVLLINAVLTVRDGEANSHEKKGWEVLTKEVISVAAQERTRGVVFMAWGKKAEEMVQGIDEEKHLILRSVHPSPYSAYRGQGFFNCGHFRQANDWLAKKYGVEETIDWDLG